jgi:hypothetical protein
MGTPLAGCWPGPRSNTSTSLVMSLTPSNDRHIRGGGNGRELGHGTFCGILSAVRLGLRLPSIFRRRRSFFLGFAGWA